MRARLRAGASTVLVVLVTAVAVLVPRPAKAERFCYVDRQGVSHQVSVDVSALEWTPDPEPRADPPPTANAAMDEDFPYASLVREAARVNSLPVELVRAVMHVESGFHPQAVSSAGAIGLMQLMPATAGDMGVTDAFDPRQNVFGGTRFLRILVNTFDGSVPLALAAYHAGASTVRRSGGAVTSKVTRKYVSDVLGIYHRLLARAATRVEGQL